MNKVTVEKVFVKNLVELFAITKNNLKLQFPLNGYWARDDKNFLFVLEKSHEKHEHPHESEIAIIEGNIYKE